MEFSKLEDFEPYTKINPNALHVELIQQSDVFYWAGKRHAEAVSKRDTSKVMLERMEADLSLKIRLKAVEAGEKPTETKVEKLILVDPQYCQQIEMWLKYKHDADDWAALIGSLEQKAKMLGELVGMHKTGYFNSGLMPDEKYEATVQGLIKARP